MGEKRHGDNGGRGSCEQEDDLERIKMIFAYVDKQGDLAKERVRKMAMEKLAGAPSAQIEKKEVTNTQSGNALSGKKRSFFRRRPWLIGAGAASLALVVVCVGLSVAMNMKGDSASNSIRDMAQESPQMSKSESSQSPNSEEVAIEPEGLNESNGSAGGSIDNTMGKKIIYKADATIKVDNVAEAINEIEVQTISQGGYIAQSSYMGNNTRATISIKIPQGSYTKFKDSLSAFGTVVELTQSTDDIGLEYFDMGARLKNMEVQEQRYLDILQGAKTVEEILKVEKALSEVRSTIESYKGQLRYWDNQVDYAQVTLTLRQDNQDIAITDPWEPTSFSKTITACKNAILKTISTIWNGLNYLLVLLAYALPVLIVGGLAWEIWFFRHKKKRKNRKQQEQ